MDNASAAASHTPQSFALPAPSLRRRLCSMMYEATLLFGVLFIAALLFSTLLQQRHALYLRHALEGWLLLVLGLYFIWFWLHGGQTLAMKTWRIRLLNQDGTRLNKRRALARFALCWFWCLPGLVLAWLTQAKGWTLVLIPSFNFVAWAALTYLDPQRQFLHDRLAGTRLVDLNPKKHAQ